VTLCTALHLGYEEQPQNFPPALRPDLAVRMTIRLPHLAQALFAAGSWRVCRLVMCCRRVAKVGGSRPV
jgi:hypothetical protein